MVERWLVPGLIALSALAIFAACLLGSTPMPAERVLAALFGGADASDRLVVWSIRLPRALAAFLTGAALGISGAALQGLLRNPLAERRGLGKFGIHMVREEIPGMARMHDEIGFGDRADDGPP